MNVRIFHALLILMALPVLAQEEDDPFADFDDAFADFDEGFEEKAFYLGRNIHDHLAAARHNVQGKSPTMLERGVYYDDLSLASIRTLVEMSEREAMQALKKVNAAARKLQARDRKAEDASYRINFGTYVYNVDENTESQANNDPPFPRPSPKGGGSS